MRTWWTSRRPGKAWKTIDRFRFRARNALKAFVSFSGVRPLHRLETLSGVLSLGEWIKSSDAHRKPHFRVREELYAFVNREVLRNAPIDYLEFGVFRGQSMRQWVALNASPESRFWGFDTFTGLPEDWTTFSVRVPRGTFDAQGRPPQIDDPRVRWVKGLFQETLDGFLSDFVPRNRLVIHFDADLYTAALYVLARVDRLLAPGTVLIFDEFSSVQNEFRAFRNYAEAFRRSYEVLGSSGPFYHQLALQFV